VGALYHIVITDVQMGKMVLDNSAIVTKLPGMMADKIRGLRRDAQPLRRQRGLLRHIRRQLVARLQRRDSAAGRGQRR
jgi:hypothetical protein